MSHLFSPLTLRTLDLPNRVVVSPMCQYSAVDGVPTGWLMQHLGALACSGAGLLMTEATHVEAIGRITPRCLGLWNDAQMTALKSIVDACRAFSTVPIGMQLAHAGRKASSTLPWEGGGPLPSESAWPTVAPSALPLDDKRPAPVELDADGLQRIQDSFVGAVQRAQTIGIDLIELHGAHGYLIHEFLSPISNTRTDDYGGSLENRMRFPLAVFTAMRAAWPVDKPMGARITGTDWSEQGLTDDDAVVFANRLKAAGADYVCVSSGGIAPGLHIPVAPGYQVPLAARVRRETGLITRAVGMIYEAEQANTLVSEGHADLVAMARAFLDDPHWVWHAADKLGFPLKVVRQYERARPDKWPRPQ